MAKLFTPYRNNLGIIVQIDRDTVTNGFNIYYSLTAMGKYTKLNQTVIPNRTAVYGLGYPSQYNQIIYFTPFTDLTDSTPKTIVYFKMTTIIGGIESNLANSAIITSKPYELQDQEYEQVEVKEIESFNVAYAYGQTTQAPLATALHTRGRKIVSGYYSASGPCTILVQVSLDGQHYRDFHTVTLDKAGEGFINYTTGWDYIKFKSEDSVDLIFELSAKN